MPSITSFLLGILLILHSDLLPAQEKGLTPVQGSALRNSGKTRALVIGISDYQYIDKLNYADRDAEIFASYLFSQGIAPEDVVLMKNKDAKRANIITELLRLAQLSQPGDNLIFYFSGHGDVENITLFKKGFLLTYDTYSNNYLAGAVSVPDIKELFVTLCNQQVKVIVITDACRSGKLAGGKEGVQFTAGLLKDIWNNEIKMLSSQPNELSQEGPQWGEGRGVFSYYLVNGMKGEADANRDSLITIKELQQFVEAGVYQSTAGKQQPIIDGPNSFSTVVVNLKQRPKATKNFSGGNSLAFSKLRFPVDSCRTFLEKMDEAIEAKSFTGSGHSATGYYQRLRECSADRSLVLGANSRLLSAMMNEAQEIVNNSFSGKKLVSPAQCDEAAALFSEVLKYNDLKLPYAVSLTNLQRYLRVISSVLYWQTASYEQANRILDSALLTEPDAPYIVLARGLIELRHGNYSDAVVQLEKASELGPGWLMPKYYLGIAYGFKREYRKALEFYEEVLKADPELRSFECAECIEKKMKEYRKRVSRIKVEKFGNDRRSKELDSLKTQLADNVDSAYYYHELALVSNKKNHPRRDSVFFYLTQAVTLDPWETEYMYSLLDYMYDESYGAREVRHWITKFLEWREDDYDEEVIVYFNEALINSYISTKEFDKATAIIARLRQDDYYRCGDLKKYNKKLGKEESFRLLWEECESPSQ
jgi:tetratricopeptide (TPR) repeat protein